MISLKDLKNLSAVKAASAALLNDLGVVLTETGKTLLAGSETSEIEAQTALAMSMEAARTGNFMTSLIYSYNAAEADASSQTAKDQADAMLSQVIGAAGSAIRSDYQNWQFWKNNLEEFERFYEEHPPYTLLYTQLPVQSGDTNYVEGTANFEFFITLRPTGVSVMQKVLNVVFRGLAETKSKKKWGFASWPTLSASSTAAAPVPTKLFNGYAVYKITTGLFNDQGELIKDVTFDMYGQMVVKGNRILVDSTQQRKMILSDVVVNELSDNMLINLISINEKSAEQSNDENYVVATVVKNMPWTKISTLPKNARRIPELPEEKDARERRESIALGRQQEKNAKAQAQEARRRAKPQRESKPLDYRFGISGAALAYPVSSFRDSASWYANVELGLRGITFEGKMTGPLDSTLYGPKGVDDGDSIFGYGVGMGYTWVWRHVLLQAGAGYSHTDLYNNESVDVPYGQMKLDLIPWSSGMGFGLRLGYILEISPKDPTGAYTRFFDESWSYKLFDVRANGKIMAGLVLWL
jgi:hypothetical protein